MHRCIPSITRLAGICVLGLASQGSVAWAQGAWQVYTAPQISGGGIQVDGPPGRGTGTILVQKGQSIPLSCNVVDQDARDNGSGGMEVKPDAGMVIWTESSGSGAFSLTRTASGDTTTYTAPNMTGTFTITAQADDEPGLAPDGTRFADDAPGATTTLNVKVIDNCPKSIGGSIFCSAVPDWTFWKSAGWSIAKMCVAGGTPPTPPGNWNGLCVHEVVAYNDIAAGCVGADFNVEPTGKCDGDSTWTLGQGNTGYRPDWNGITTKCFVGDSDNCLNDAFWDRWQTGLYLKPNKGPCTIICDQEYFCNTNSLGKFKINRTFTLINNGANCKVEYSR